MNEINVNKLTMGMQTRKNLLAVAGVALAIFGIVFLIPLFLKESYLLAVLSTILLVAGIVLIAIAFGD